MSKENLDLINVLEYERGVRTGYGYALPELQRLTALVEKKHQEIERVRHLHRNNNGYCTECLGDWEKLRYPCPTIKALEGEQ